MKAHSVRVATRAQPLSESDHLAWKLAEVATGAMPPEQDVAEAVVDRLIDSFGVAIAALNHQTVAVAMDQALARPKSGGALLIGSGDARRVECEWAAWANTTAIRELDLHDNYYGANVIHPADMIGSILAVAQQCGAHGQAVERGVATAYEVAIRLADSFALTDAGIDHVALYGPAVVTGLGAMLSLPTRTIYEAINHAAHVSVSTTQVRRGKITGWKANAPAHVGKVAIEAVDRAMRGEEGPKPVFEGQFGWLAVLLGGASTEVQLLLPEPGEPHKAILESYTKAHATGYHAQAFIDLAFRLREKIDDFDAIDKVEIHTKAYTHNYVGSGSGDPEKYSPEANHETLDHSVMFTLAAALLDGEFHHQKTFERDRVQRPDLVRLWHKVSTVAEDEWTRRFRDRSGLEKDHGGRVIVTFQDGSTIADEIAVPDAHPRGSRPFTRDDYIRKFSNLTEGLVDPSEKSRLLELLAQLHHLDRAQVADLGVLAKADITRVPTRGIF